MLLFAQPTTWKAPYAIPAGKGVGFYSNEAKREQKDGNYHAAVTLAAHTLLSEPKRGQIAEAQDVLRESYDLAISLTDERVALINQRGEIFQGDTTANECYETVRLLKEAIAFTELLQQVPAELFLPVKKKDLPIVLAFNDYMAKLADVEQELALVREQCAAMHYQRATILAQGRSVSDNRTAAQKFAMSLSYVPDYSDAKERFEEARRKGTTHLRIEPLDDQIDVRRFGNPGRAASFETNGRLLNAGVNNLPFFQLVGLNDPDPSEGGLVVCRGVIIKVDVKHEALYTTIDSTYQEKTIDKQIIDSEDNPKTIKEKVLVWGKYKEFTKSAVCTVQYTVQIVDPLTNRMLQTQSFTSTNRWDASWKRKLSGPDEAFADSYKREFVAPEPAYIGDIVFLDETARGDIAQKMTNMLLQYAQSVGR
ncbi:MAG: hypothetical protein OHK0039_38280 [Bacteroidia bacterium]